MDPNDSIRSNRDGRDASKKLNAIDEAALWGAIASASASARACADQSGGSERAANLKYVALWDYQGARIVECVKACAPLAHPSLDIVAMANALKAAQAVIRHFAGAQRCNLQTEMDRFEAGMRAARDIV